ncbi:hypothetical protein SDC9_147718 [bioreactor metagenome]|uniref:Uncharacterized protein n=1 Tax=bioreactor metagenome TaxID=1076179 RepID=A0A645EIW6_9ZZZZ
MRNRRRPRVKLLAVGSVAGTQALSDTVSAHRAPFVMVAFQPDVIQILEPVVFGDLLWRQMAMVIEDRLVFRIIMIQTAGKFSIK